MRKYVIIAAAAGGLLAGGAPAYADQHPAGPLGGLLDPAGGGVNLDNPVDGDPIIKVKPGSDTPALPAAPGLPTAGLPTSDAAPTEDASPSARTGLGGARSALPAAGAVGGPPLGSVRNDDFAVADVPVGRLLNGGGVPGLGLMPDGSAPLAPTGRSTRESGLLGGGVPLLGGLGGLLPEPARTLPADGPDTSGMPAGGTTVDPSDIGDPSDTGDPADIGDPAATGGPDQPAGDPPGKPGIGDPATDDPDPSGPGDDDKRVHEEPTDDEAGGRSFSTGRPVAGEDPDYE
ncbi:MAG TPA: hypothetical protein VFH03_21930 [Actinoplanes sp.]|nr:hypothetical protein [Actinoplanes sp.]